MDKLGEVVKGQIYKLEELEKRGYKNQNRTRPWPPDTQVYTKQKKRENDEWYDITNLILEEIISNTWDGSRVERINMRGSDYNIECQILEVYKTTSSKPIFKDEQPS